MCSRTSFAFQAARRLFSAAVIASSSRQASTRFLSRTSSTIRGWKTWKVIFLARPRSFTVLVPALGRRPSLSHRCRSVVEMARMSSTSRGMTGRLSMPTSAWEMIADAVRKSAAAFSGMRKMSELAVTPSAFFVAAGRRARTSSRRPFARTEDPSVAAAGRAHTSVRSAALSESGELTWT